MQEKLSPGTRQPPGVQRVPVLWGLGGQFEALTRRLLPDPVVGAGLGFVVGYMAAIGPSFLGIDAPKFLAPACGILGATGGCTVGVLRQGRPGKGKAVGWWCATLVIGMGSVSLFLGFVACMLLVSGRQTPLLAF